MRPYAERRAARIERLYARAEKKRAESAGAYAAADRVAQGIPMGQPILVGHHSERHHRRDLARIDSGMRRSVEADKAAHELERRAAAAESNDAISSDDPDATTRLREKIVRLEDKRDHAKRLNAVLREAIRRGKKQGVDWQLLARVAYAAMCLPPRLIEELLTPDGRQYGIPAYVMTNTGAEIRRLQARLADLERRATAPEVEDLVLGDVRIADSENRTRIYFPGKPAEAVRRELKSFGFRWSPSEGAWQRHASSQARYYAEQIVRRHYVARASA